ncbi:MAG TPA: collagen-binding domain-containing protein [Flavobacteriaceae bacterium]|nr:collagen-binding domain-containing protein [Flavobacteriaceae bacterium]
MKQLLLRNLILTGLFAMLFIQSGFCQYNPTDAALDFNVFLENNATLKSNESEGPVAIGGDLTVGGNYQVNIHNYGTFQVGGLKIGLLVGGKVFYNSGILRVNERRYVKLGVNDGSSTVWYRDPNNATPPIRITPGPFNASSAIHLQVGSNDLGVSASNNPVFQGGLINFTDAFRNLRNASTDIAQCAANAHITNPNGNVIPLPHNTLPNQIKIQLQNGVNVFNISGSDLSRIAELTYVNKPSATRVLVINVDAPGTFNWKVWNQPGIGFSDTSYIIYNFYNTTQLNIVSGATIEGTVFAPYAHIDKTGHNSNIQGQVIAKSLIQTGGEIHYGKFQGFVGNCGPATPPTQPVANFQVNKDKQCFVGNSFVFTDTSTDADSYLWDFGDGTTSTNQNPVMSFTAPGDYTVTLTATNAHGSDSKTMAVKVYSPVHPIVAVTGSVPGTGSVTKEITLTNSTDFQTFSWILPGTTTEVYHDQNTITIEFTTAGYYELKVVTKDNNGCDGMAIFPIVIDSGEVSTGNGGGVESHSLGDAISKINLQRKKNSIPTHFNVEKAEKFEKLSSTSAGAAQRGAGQTLLEMFPTQLIPGDAAHISSPTDILDYTIAKEVLSVDFVYQGQTKGVVLGIRTEDRVYNHTKASCDRLRGAEVLAVMPVKLQEYDFLMQAIKQRDGKIEYAISFAIGKNENQDNYSLQSNWFVNDYTAADQVYNFQAWSTNPENTRKLVTDILRNLNDYTGVEQNEIQKLPKTFVSKIDREGEELILKLKSQDAFETVELVMEQNTTETNGYAQRYLPLNSQPEQIVKVAVGDAYEFDGVVLVNNEVQDAFYHADGNWGLDFDATYTIIENYTVYNNPDRIYVPDEKAVHRNVQVQAHSEYDYLTLYKSLLPGGLSDDYSEYNFISFTAKGSGWLDVALIKSSVLEWSNQFKVTIDVGNEENTYFIPFDVFKSAGSQNKLSANDLTMLTFTFLPAEAQTNDLDLVISDVKFTKTAPEGYESGLIMMENQFVVYPNPSKGMLNTILYSKENTIAEMMLYDMTGRVVHAENIPLSKGRNEISQTFEVPSGIYFLKIENNNTRFGTSKIIIGN